MFGRSFRRATCRAQTGCVFVPFRNAEQEPVRSLDGGMHTPTIREWLNSGMPTGTCFHRLEHSEYQHQHFGSLEYFCCDTRTAGSWDYCSTHPRATLIRDRADATFGVAPAKSRSPAPLWGIVACTHLFAARREAARSQQRPTRGARPQACGALSHARFGLQNAARLQGRTSAPQGGGTTIDHGS